MEPPTYLIVYYLLLLCTTSLMSRKTKIHFNQITLVIA